MLEHVLARRFKESAASATATPSSQADPIGAQHCTSSSLPPPPPPLQPPTFSDPVDEHSQHRAPLPGLHICTNRPHDATNARTTHPAFLGPSRDRLRPNSTTCTQPKQPWQLYAMAMLSENQISSSNHRRSSSAESSGRRSASNTTASAYVVNAATMDLTAYQYSTCGAGGMYTPWA